LLGVLWRLLAREPDPISFSNYLQIKNGTTKDVVYELLGRSYPDRRLLIPITGTAPPNGSFHMELPPFPQFLSGYWENWIGDEGTLVVVFNSNDLVIGKAFTEREVERSLLERVIRWLGL